MAKKHKHTDRDATGAETNETPEAPEVDDDPTANPPGSTDEENSERPPAAIRRDPEVPLGGNVPGETDEERKARVAQITGQPLENNAPLGVRSTSGEVTPPSGGKVIAETERDRREGVERGDYHPNEALRPHPAGLEAQPTHTAPLLDADTHDFGPTGAEEECRVCGLTRDEIALKVGKPLTVAELEHPDVKNTALLPPRIR